MPLMITFTPQQSFFLFCAYFIAAIPFGVLVSNLVAGKDVREQGSGNTGAANVSRLMGKQWGVVVLLLDALKGYAAVALAHHYGDLKFANLVAVVAIFAHCYPVYLGFKGGKGVATAMGIIAALSLPTLAICGGVFIIVVLATRRISAGSLTGALSLPLVTILRPSPLKFLSACVIAVIICWNHRENVLRLWKNQEPKFF
jgi:acyl phosphate:glycerol-3-phosphate acyltransferase